jgi:predicted neuraminidase
VLPQPVESSFESKVFEHERDFEVGSRFFNHVPTIAALPDGSLVVAWFGGQWEGSLDNSVLLSRSEDDGTTWSAPATVIPATDEESITADPLLFQTGRLWLLYRLRQGSGTGSRVSDLKAYAISSLDGGLTWDEPRLVDLGKDRTFGPLNPPVIPDGRLAFGYYWRDFDSRQTHIGMAIASPDLRTWESRGDVMLQDRRTLEPVLVSDPAGILYLYIRTDLNRIYRSVSIDNGFTWTRPEPLNVPSPDSMSDVHRLTDGRYLVAWNNHPDSRDYLAVGVFSDSRLDTLQQYQLVPRQGETGANYPRLIIQEGEVLTAFSWIRRDNANHRFGDIWIARYI